MAKLLVSIYSFIGIHNSVIHSFIQGHEERHKLLLEVPSRGEEHDKRLIHLDICLREEEPKKTRM